MVGIIEEQHPDRARLFMQWKRMNWPILVDSLNLLEVSVVPITLLIDEHGVIRFVGPSEEEFQHFLEADYPPSGPAEKRLVPKSLEHLKRAAASGDPSGLRESANALFLWEGDSRISEVIQSYQESLARDPDHAPGYFRLGVAYRRRYDSEFRRPGDFALAVQNWQKALEMDPNQYIWRRRIQQYGPRLDKPYPFYDWVLQARRDLQARGETPAELRVEPGGAEFASPLKEFQPGPAQLLEPDPKGRIWRDSEGLIEVETTVVPSPVKAGSTARVHVILRPDLARKAHWNNEVKDLKFWVQAPAGWQVDTPLLSYPNPPEAVSQETRKVEFEVKIPEDFSGSITLPSYALYFVCEDVDGTCLYRRQDIPLELEVR